MTTEHAAPTGKKPSAPLQGKTSLFGFSPWLLVGLSLILAAIIIVLALRSTERERGHITQNFLDRADSLMGALEAGTKTGIDLGEDARLVQPFVVELSRLRGVLYIAIVDTEGRILAHSDPRQVGQILAQERLPSHAPPSAIAWHERHAANSAVYEVYREFAPAPGYHHSPEIRHAAEAAHTHPPDDAATPAPAGHVPSSFVLIGFDKTPYEKNYADDRFSSIMTSLVAAALGLGSFFSLFWAYSHQRSRRLLKNSRALASEVVTCLPVGLMTCTPDGLMSMLNAVALRMLHLREDQAVGRPLRSIPGPDWASITSRLDRKEKILEREMSFDLPEGAIPVSLSASAIRNEDGLFLGYLFILRDISAMKRLQAEARRNDRLTALGTLAAGVAHEIRNPLGSIKALATFLVERAAPAALEEEAAKTLSDEVDRLNRVVSQLLDFAKPGVLKLAATDINEVVARALRLADADLRAKSIQVAFVADGTLPRVPLHAERCTQALLNIFLNAAQSMERGGHLDISLAPADGEKSLSVRIKDDGCGMSAQTQASLFTPYFTTKKSGTGLGLAIVRQIVEGHGGRIEVQSTADAGSVFTLLFPVDGRPEE